MHDYALLENLCLQLESLARSNGAQEIARILLEIGPSSHHTPEHMQDTFELLRGSSPLLQNAKIEFRISPELQAEELILRDVELVIS